ncbi:MAG: STN domain-containing protein [Planctomycetales bacterium]|nr:STN domain-containing protein [Planctomycetales bacterium]
MSRKQHSRHAPRDEPSQDATSIGHSAHHAERDGYVNLNQTGRWAMAAIVIGLVLCLSQLLPAAETIDKLAGKPFTDALERSLSGTWENLSLRAITTRVGTTQRVALLLDRRLDPDLELSAQAQNQTTLNCLRDLVSVQQGNAVAVGNTIYLGPTTACGRLRTLIELRRDELSDSANGAAKVPQRRMFDLNKRTTIRWEDLEPPREIVRKIAEQFALKVEQLELVPHDLWAGATLPQATASEALSLVLIQFDLTFEWLDRGNGIRIAKTPERIVISKFHTPPRGSTAAQAAERWREAYPDAEIEVDKSRIRVVGTIEQHEELDRSALPPKAAPKNSKERRVYSLKVKASVSALMQAIEKTAGVQFEYDAAALRKAEVDLAKPVSVDVKEAPLETLLDAVFSPLGVKYEVDGKTVRLKPGP